jgi:hypothetical protein
MAKKQKKNNSSELPRYEMHQPISNDDAYMRQSEHGDYVLHEDAQHVIGVLIKEVDRLTKQKEAIQRVSNFDLRDIQVYAARYAHNHMTFAPLTVNNFTALLIEAGIPLCVDQTRDAEKPDGTVWVKDGGFGWPDHLIEKYGWDGRKLGK